MQSTVVPVRLLGVVIALALACLALVAPASAHAGKARLDRTERKLVRFINHMRRAHGLPRVRVSRGLNRAANFHSWEMVVWDFFAHHSRDGRSSPARVRRYRRARATGENIAFVPAGQRGVAWTVVTMWMHSPAHRAVLLGPGFRRVGVGRRAGRLGAQRGTVFTADFTSRR